ncbi:MAG: tetratricopeptide repeat protein [Alphaproteobacteria bacterium]|nr:tetratricopeptide repeat protein [Alphaproteobacteria bacterium]
MTHITRRFCSVFSIALVGLCLSACADSVSVEAPTKPQASTSNIKSKASGPQIERKLYTPTSSREPEKEIEDEDDATATLLRTAEKMMASNDLTSASMLYQRAFSTNPDSIAALKGMARVAELREKPQEALQAYREIIRLDNDNEAGHMGVAKNLMTLGLHDKAIDQLNKFREIKGDSPEVLNMLGMAYTRADEIPGHYEKAIESFKTSIAIDPDRLSTQNNMGFTYILAGRLNEAIAIFEKLVDDPRVTVQHRQNLALAYGMAGRENDARKIAMQDLPRAAVEKNIASYRKMRQKVMGITPDEPKLVLKKTPVKKSPKPEVKKEEPKAETSPAAAPVAPAADAVVPLAPPQ